MIYSQNSQYESLLNNCRNTPSSCIKLTEYIKNKKLVKYKSLNKLPPINKKMEVFTNE